MFYVFPRVVNPDVCEQIIKDCKQNILEEASVYNYDKTSTRDDPEIRKTSVHFIKDKDNKVNELAWRFLREANKILFNYNKTKNNIEKRMVFDAIRNYKYKVNTDDFDEFVTSRIDDLISYEYYVDQNTESIFYKNYYNGQGPSEKFVGLTNFTKNELNSLLDRTHPFYKYEGQEGMTYGFPLAINIKIKIEEVYDSTAVASIYKSRDANIKLRVGDIVKY